MGTEQAVEGPAQPWLPGSVGVAWEIHLVLVPVLSRLGKQDESPIPGSCTHICCSLIWRHRDIRVVGRQWWTDVLCSDVPKTKKKKKKKWQQAAERLVIKDEKQEVGGEAGREGRMPWASSLLYQKVVLCRHDQVAMSFECKKQLPRGFPRGCGKLHWSWRDAVYQCCRRKENDKHVLKCVGSRLDPSHSGLMRRDNMKSLVYSVSHTLARLSLPSPALWVPESRHFLTGCW